MLTLTVPEVDHAGRYRSGEPACALHAHRGFELLAICSGRCRVEIEGQDPVEARAGALFLIPPHRSHIHFNHGQVATAYVVFRLPLRVLPPRVRSLEVGAADPLRIWLDQAIDLHRRLVGPGDRELGGLLLAILGRLDRLDPPSGAAGRPRPLALAERHLIANLGGPVGMGELAHASGVGARHLRSLFQDHHGCPPARWHRRRRIELAKRLLLDRYLSVSQIAAACGWPDANLFGRQFRAECGEAPGRWRERLRAGQGGRHPGS
jgi:AraC-like DNA-binding protein